jgi:hypothetical protein
VRWEVEGKVSQPGASSVTACGSGTGSDASAALAAEQALAGARQRLGKAPPELGLLFASSKLPLPQVLATARSMLPGVDFVACTTAGEITERGLTHDGVAAMLISWSGARHSLRIVTEPESDVRKLADELCAAGMSTASAPNYAACLLLGDGLSPVFEKLVEQVRRSSPTAHAILGAGAADGRRFVSTAVGVNDTVASGAMAALRLESERPWGVGVAHGLVPATPRMTVTRARGNVVTEIDDRPALEVYREFAASRRVTLDSENTPQFLVENELGVLLFQDVVRVRAPLRVVREDELWFAGEVPEGSSVCIVRGEPDDIIAAARVAAEEAKRELGSGRAAGVLVFSCVCRAMVLGDRYAEEIAAIRSVFPDVPLAGFSSYGEVARTRNKLDGYHNNTVVVAAIPE